MLLLQWTTDAVGIVCSNAGLLRSKSMRQDDNIEDRTAALTWSHSTMGVSSLDMTGSSASKNT